MKEKKSFIKSFLIYFSWWLMELFVWELSWAYWSETLNELGRCCGTQPMEAKWSLLHCTHSWSAVFGQCWLLLRPVLAIEKTKCDCVFHGFGVVGTAMLVRCFNSCILGSCLSWRWSITCVLGSFFWDHAPAWWAYWTAQFYEGSSLCFPEHLRHSFYHHPSSQDLNTRLIYYVLILFPFL